MILGRTLLDLSAVVVAGAVSQLEPVTASAVGQWLWSAVGVGVMIKIALDIKNGWSHRAQAREITGQPIEVQAAEEYQTRPECERRHHEASKEMAGFSSRIAVMEGEIRESNRRVHERMDKLVETIGAKFEGIRADIGGLGGEIRRMGR